MNDIEALRRRFGMGQELDISEGRGGLPRIAINAPYARGEIYLHGAHVTHYQPAGQPPVLFLSEQSAYEPAKPIRGGVPVIFPWFGQNAANSDLPMHGFARTAEWTLRTVKQNDANVAITLSLDPTETSGELWPYSFQLLYTVSFGASLEMTLEVVNSSRRLFEFEEALHTYFVVSDIKQVSVEGLDARSYLDKTEGMQRKTQQGAIRFDGETDRVYLETTDHVIVSDPSSNRRITVWKEGSMNTVVWNPWIEKSRRMPDFGDDEWPRMVCVETANVGENSVRLAPDERHLMRAMISSGAMS